MPRVHFAAIFLSLSRGFISTFNNILLSCAVPNFQSLLSEKIESQSPSWFRAGRELLHLADSLILTSLKHRLTRFIIITWARPTSAHRTPCHLDSPCWMVQSYGQSVLPCADSPLNLELDAAELNPTRATKPCGPRTPAHTKRARRGVGDEHSLRSDVGKMHTRQGYRPVVQVRSYRGM